MTGYFTEEKSVDIVNSRIGPDADARLRQIMTSLVRHAHAFVKDVQLTQEEWQQAIEFLTRTGQTCSVERQEFILLSDVLGISMLVDAVSNRLPEGATQSTVLGPFHVPGAPELAMGENICLDGKGDGCLFEGRVLDLDGNPVENARLDVWSDNAEGFYDVQQPAIQPKWNNRGIFTTGADGKYSFVGIRPISYPIPDDGPVGQLLRAMGRHPYRPAHIHFIVTASGFAPLVTHLFVGDDDYITSDAVFGVKRSLISSFEHDDQLGMWRAAFDFVLAPAQANSASGAEVRAANRGEQRR